MEIDWNKINVVHDNLVERIKSENGKSWKASSSELHSDYNEMPFWILLYENSDVNVVHKKFRAIVSPCFQDISPVQCTVAYSVITQDLEIQVDFLNDNAEILSSPEKNLLGEYPSALGSRASSAFKGMDSKR